jgi:hypothetical protein
MIKFLQKLFRPKWEYTGNSRWVTTQDLSRYYYQEEFFEYRHIDTGKTEWRLHPARTRYRFVDKQYVSEHVS